MEEIFFRKSKKGWVAYDRNGHSIEAPTKDMARMQYYMYYGNHEVTNNLFDMSNVERTL